MRRRPSSSPFANREDPEMTIAGLIDIAFLLLIYFLVTTTLAKQEADLSLVLPGLSSVSGSPVQIDQMRIEIDPAGVILVNREVSDSDINNRGVPALSDRLQRYAAAAMISRSDPMVVIKCDRQVPEQRFIDVLNACARARIDHVSISP